ncbi:hypothetical protein BAT_2249 [Bacillus pumilus ATCC 7061]|nr:hypothetical protein BAT_2249 [Bacillus pumilus ATCC 7061]
MKFDTAKVLKNKMFSACHLDFSHFISSVQFSEGKYKGFIQSE